MNKLSKPSRDLSRRILSEVDFANRLIGFRLRERTGPILSSLYSFAEVLGLLCDPHPRIDFHRLLTWIREVMKDRELAFRVENVIGDDVSDQDKTLRIRNLMAERLIQCKKAI